jgi:hypothetical protein
MFGDEYEEEISEILMSNKTISLRIQDTSQDIESQVIANIKETDSFWPSSWTSQLMSLEKLYP